MANNSPQLSALTVAASRRSHTLSYFDRPSSAPAILHVHELGCSKADFMEVASLPELQSFRLVFADNPGCGVSPYDGNHPLNIDGVVELMESLVTHLRLNRFRLAGGSMGGLVASLYAEQNPRKIAGLVNVEGNLAPQDCMFSHVIPHFYCRLQHSPREKSKMKQSIKHSSLALVALILLALAGTSPYSPGQTQNQAAGSVRSRADETLEWWNQIGNKLIAMAKDFPEDKYDFKVQQDERTFAQNLLHVAAVDYDLIDRVSGSNRSPDLGKDKHNPSQDLYKTKADVVKLLEQAVADGAAVIKQHGDAGLDKTTQFGWETGQHVVHNSYIWITAIQHSSEHFGQLVVYYRANNLVPPESRRQ
jgi:pimeloyl-ACP methyl ester carboxylesterase